MKNLGPLAASLLLFSWLTGCGVPWEQGTTLPPPPPGSATTLVFHTAPAGRAFADLLTAAEYLTLELKLESDPAQRSFATATKDGNGDFVVTVPGLVAGQWRLRVFLYGSEATGDLLLYARQTEYLAPGQVRDDIVLALYSTASLGTVTPGTDLDAHHLVLDPQGDLYDQEGEAPRIVGSGVEFPLFATVYSGVPTGQPDEFQLAADQRVLWSTSEQEVAVVSSLGKVTALQPGKAVITAVSVENGAALALYHLEVVSGIEGSWKNPHTPQSSGNELFRFQGGRWTYFSWQSLLDPQTYDPSSLALRGTYTLTQDRVVMVTEGLLFPGQVEWLPFADGLGFQRIVTHRYSITDDQLLLYNESSGILVERALFYDVEASGARVVEDPLSAGQVTLPDVAPVNGTLNVGLGDTVNLGADFGLATIDQLVWISSDPAVFSFFDPDGNYILYDSVQQTGTTVLRGYALDALDYSGTLASSGLLPLVEVTLTVQDSTGPIITTSDLSASAYFMDDTPFSFTVFVSDPSGLGPTPTVAVDGGAIVVTVLPDAPGEFTVDVPAIGTPGSYSVEITAQDSLGNPTSTMFSLEVSSPPL